MISSIGSVFTHGWVPQLCPLLRVAVAEEMGYDIVTDRPEVHRWVVSCDDVVDMLVGGQSGPNPVR